jgi:hypothetical protein
MQPSYAISIPLLGGTLLLASCQRVVPPRSELTGVAQVGEVVITQAQLQQKLQERRRRPSSGPITVADRDAALDELVQFESLFVQAQRAGWHTNAEILTGFKRMVVGRYQEQALACLDVARATPAEIEQYWQQNSTQFTLPEQIHGAILILEVPAKATPERRSQAALQAAELRERALQEAATEAHFGALAQRFSADQSTRYAGGDFGLRTLREIENRYGGDVAQALADLKVPGAMSGVIKTPRGFGLVKLIQRRSEHLQPLAKVREGIEYQITKAKQLQAERDFLASARRSVDVRINQKLLDGIPLPERSSEPPPVPQAESASLSTH